MRSVGHALIKIVGVGTVLTVKMTFGEREMPSGDHLEPEKLFDGVGYIGHLPGENVWGVDDEALGKELDEANKLSVFLTFGFGVNTDESTGALAGCLF